MNYTTILPDILKILESDDMLLGLSTRMATHVLSPTAVTHDIDVPPHTPIRSIAGVPTADPADATSASDISAIRSTVDVSTEVRQSTVSVLIT